ncbi:MAG: hypothetical protein ACK6BZ_11875 [Candidatus Kapaibacterium sp.]|jgi:hypothetical protein
MIKTVNEFIAFIQSDNTTDQFRARYDNADIKIWLEIIKNYPDFKTWVIHNKTVQIEILEILCADKDPNIRSDIAKKLKINDFIFNILSVDPDENVRYALMCNTVLSVDKIKKIKVDDSTWLTEKLADIINIQMPIRRNTFYGNDSLIDSYIELSKHSHPHWADFGKSMVMFLTAANRLFKTTEVWGYTSHYELKLQAENTLHAPCYVQIAPTVGGEEDYEISYVMPVNKAPLKHAVVSGIANSLDEAMYYLLVAMKESDGWKESSELLELLSKY